jgi:hypothetical protein
VPAAGSYAPRPRRCMGAMRVRQLQAVTRHAPRRPRTHTHTHTTRRPRAHTLPHTRRRSHLPTCLPTCARACACSCSAVLSGRDLWEGIGEQGRRHEAIKRRRSMHPYSPGRFARPPANHSTSRLLERSTGMYQGRMRGEEEHAPVHSAGSVLAVLYTVADRHSNAFLPFPLPLSRDQGPIRSPIRLRVGVMRWASAQGAGRRVSYRPHLPSSSRWLKTVVGL